MFQDEPPFRGAGGQKKCVLKGQVGKKNVS